MITQQILHGNWNEIKGRLRSKWGELTDDDVMTFNGDVDQLVGTIQKRTGEARVNVERFFDEFVSDASNTLNHSRDNVRKAANYAVNGAEEASQQAVASMRCGYAEAEGIVRRHPTETLVVCLASGLVAEIAAGLLLKSR